MAEGSATLDELKATHGLEDAFDLLIVGGGVNGAGIARDAAGRGLRVLLCEKSDLASATSSASSKLIHGGLRYLEYYEFRLVREALNERETLLRMAPHIIWPLRFILPHHKALRPKWLLRTGLFLYDHLGGRKILPPTKTVDLSTSPKGAALRDDFKTGFEYSDCWVDDARLVVLNALDAKERGAEVLTRTRFVSAERGEDAWRARLVGEDGAAREIVARSLINAAGPWVGDVLRGVSGHNARGGASLRLVKGSHVVVDKVFEGDHAFIFQNADGRVMFAIPYERDYTLLGTTDVPHKDDVENIDASDEEIDYVLSMASEYFAEPIGRDRVRRTYAGVRPLYDDSDAKDASAVTRDYVFDVDAAGGAPLLSIYGGKITTYRKLSEHAMRELQPHLGFTEGPWTKTSRLPGGEIEAADFDGFLDDARARKPWLEPSTLRRLARAYGSRLDDVLGGAASTSDLGRDFGGGVFEAELAYLRDVEWARAGDDALWRRSKLGLHVGPDTAQAVKDYFET